MLTALQQVLLKAGNTINPEAMNKVASSLVELLGSDEENIRLFAGKCVGAYSKFVDEKQLDSFLGDTILNNQRSWQMRHGCCLALKSIIHNASTNTGTNNNNNNNSTTGSSTNPQLSSLLAKHQKAIISLLLNYLTDDKVPVRQSACETLGKLIVVKEIVESSAVLQLLAPIAELISDNSNDVKITALKVVKKLAKLYPSVSRKHLSVLVPPVMISVKDRTNFPVKLASERTLVHLLEIHTPNSNTLQEYAQTLDSAQSKVITDYAKRILSKLAEHSDSEGERSDDQDAE